MIQARFAKNLNVVKTTYYNRGGVGCRGECNKTKCISKLYILLHAKTCNCEYFTNVFLNLSTNMEVEVL